MCWGLGDGSRRARRLDRRFFGDGIVHVPGGRWVRTFEKTTSPAARSGWLRVDRAPAQPLRPVGALEMAAGGCRSTRFAARRQAAVRGLPWANWAWMVVARPVRWLRREHQPALVGSRQRAMVRAPASTGPTRAGRQLPLQQALPALAGACVPKMASKCMDRLHAAAHRVALAG